MSSGTLRLALACALLAARALLVVDAPPPDVPGLNPQQGGVRRCPVKIQGSTCGRPSRQIGGGWYRCDRGHEFEPGLEDTD